MFTQLNRFSVTSRLTALLCLLLIFSGCSTVYYSAMEKLGVEKRDILVDRVGEARDAQSDASETFRSSLEQFQSVVDTPNTGLQQKYDVISKAFYQCHFNKNKRLIGHVRVKKSETTAV